MQPIENANSKQPFVQILPGANMSKVKLPDILGCCGNMFKFSYVRDCLFQLGQQSIHESHFNVFSQANKLWWWCWQRMRGNNWQ